MSAPRFDPRPITLRGAHVQLEPLEPAHAEALFAAGQDDAIWSYLPVPRQTRIDQTRAWIAAALAARDAGAEIPFAVTRLNDESVVGSTRYLDLQRAHRGLEVGWTWLAPSAQRSAVNTECKLLLLTHAFERLGAVRVCLKCDGRNERSQRAIERLGGIREGVLRHHRRCWDGVLRDTVYYSILSDEWPAVRERLTQRVVT